MLIMQYSPWKSQQMRAKKKKKEENAENENTNEQTLNLKPNRSILFNL